MRFFIGILLLEGVLTLKAGKCGRNARYTQCGTACPLTCDNLDNPPESCAARCRRGCQCEEGFVRFRTFHCVKPEDCPKSSEPRPNLVIKDDQNRLLKDVAGPYNEGDSLTLICETKAVSLSPSVSWWTNNKLIDNSFSRTSGGLIQNALVIVKLRRSNFMQEFTCEMQHPNITQTLNVSVKIDMNLKPLSVLILTPPKPVSAETGEYLNALCRTSGSRPESKIVWWIDNEQIQEENETLSSRWSVFSVSFERETYSGIIFTPSIDDNGKILTCKAENPAFPRLDMRDTWTLRVQYKIQRNCTASPDLGFCFPHLDRFYYDSDEQICKEFTFGGCGGNTNNFETEEACKAYCGVKSRSDCLEAKEVGTCKSALPRYFFNNQTGECERFIYSGCEGSSNNFNLMEDCEKVCLN